MERPKAEAETCPPHQSNIWAFKQLSTVAELNKMAEVSAFDRMVEWVGMDGWV